MHTPTLSRRPCRGPETGFFFSPTLGGYRLMSAPSQQHRPPRSGWLWAWAPTQVSFVLRHKWHGGGAAPKPELFRGESKTPPPRLWLTAPPHGMGGGVEPCFNGSRAGQHTARQEGVRLRRGVPQGPQQGRLGAGRPLRVQLEGRRSVAHSARVWIWGGGLVREVARCLPPSGGGANWTLEKQCKKKHTKAHKKKPQKLQKKNYQN